MNLAKALGLLCVVVVVSLQSMRQKRRQSRAMDGWPSTEGTIYTGEKCFEGNRNWVELTYTYFVDEYRSGTYVRNVRDSDEGERFISSVQGKNITVFYDPSHPDESAIMDRDVEMITSQAPQLG